MKIVQVLPELNEGGVERGTVELNREYVKKGLESIVISNGGKLVSQIEKDGGEHYTFDVCSKNILTIFPRILSLRKLLKKIQPDIIHVRSRVPAWLVYFANKKLNFKIVSTVHGFNSIGFYSKIMTKADAIICVSGSLKDYILNNYNISEDLITVISRGVDLKLFNPDNLDKNFIKSFKKEYSLDNSFLIASIGRITQLKDYETFIKAISLIKKEKSNVKALIVGGVRNDKKEYIISLKTLIKELNLEKNIIFTGSQSKIAEIYSLVDVIVSSSKKPESFGRTVAESIAMNTPVVATNHGGVRDIIDENINGFFFEIGNEEELAEKILKSSCLKFNGYTYISKKFSLHNMVEKTFSLYKKI